MLLGHIERGTVMYVCEERDGQAASDICEAEFRYLENDRVFDVRCKRLGEFYGKLDRDAPLSISFMTGPYVNTFTGRMTGKRHNDLIQLEQLSDIESRNRRKSDRDEIRVGIRLYQLPASDMAGPFHRRMAGGPVLTDMIFDISIDGLCVVTDAVLSCETDPFYLAEFSLGERDYHFLPAKLVRRSECPRTSIGKFDYGFEFIFDNLPNEPNRIISGILHRKLYGA